MKLKYIDVLPRFFPSLPTHPKGIGVKKGDVIVVTEKEAQMLMRMKNGRLDCFEKVDKPKKTFLSNDKEMEES